MCDLWQLMRGVKQLTIMHEFCALLAVGLCMPLFLCRVPSTAHSVCVGQPIIHVAAFSCSVDGTSRVGEVQC